MLHKNKGIDLEKEKLEQDGTEWTFGALSKIGIANIPSGEREKYLPKGERQNIGEEKMDCASRWVVNKIETELNYLLKNKLLLPQNETWLRDNGYITEHGFELSDAFIAILSGTTRQGNSLKSPLQAAHEYGMVPKRLLPQLDTFDAHHDKSRITGSILAIGEQFKQRFPINYEKVFEVHYKELLKDDLLGVAAFAWPTPKNGVYPKTDNEPNHAFLLYDLPTFQAFDNYEEAPGDFTKNLAPDFNFYEYGYRVFISAQYLPSNKSWMADLISKIWQVFFSVKENVPEPVITPVIKQEPKPMTNQEKFLKMCLDALDTDPSTPDNVKDELGCADTISQLLKKVYPDFPILLSTKDLDTKLFMDKRFRRVTEPGVGRIIISPRTATKNGHVGAWITSERIASNDSKTGLFKGNYTWNSWIKEMKDKRGLKIYIYELI